MKWLQLIPLALLLCCHNADAGEWFKTFRFSASLGDEHFSCERGGCGGYDIGEGVIGEVTISQSIYSAKWGRFRLRSDIKYVHMSDIETSFYETPIDYIGVGFSGEFDWY